MFSRMFTDYSRDVRARLPHIAFVQETNKSVAAIAALADWSDRAKAASAPVKAKDRIVPPVVRALLARVTRSEADITLDEAESKALLHAYGLAAPREMVARDGDDAVRAAGSIGYPVVLKALSSSLPHKSDAGGVLLGLRDGDAVRAGVDTIRANLKTHGAGAPDGFLVCEMVSGGVELVFGAQRDPEMGPVIMAGSGGILLELIKDVRFAALPLDAAKAKSLIGTTRIATLLKGYRGSAPHDLEALASALVAVAQLADDLGEALQSIDVNPIVSRAGHRPVALDAVVILKGGRP